MKSPGKICVVERFAPLRERLLTLLAELADDDWVRPTAAPGWSVKDVATHLLGGDISILSYHRDGFRSAQKIDSYADLVELVDRLNREWITAARRFSPQLLREFLAFTGPQVEACFAAKGSHENGRPGFHGRGRTRRNLYGLILLANLRSGGITQQQIRDASGRFPLYEPYFFAPVLDTFVRALPHAFRNTNAPSGTSVRFEIAGDAGGLWCLYKVDECWALILDVPNEPTTTVVLPQDVAWRLFTKGFDREKARSLASIGGRAELAAPIFATTAIIGR